ncbi:MAG: LytTR family DNA-binding domain-containing protein [Bacteroidota bacterium]|jgi:two-component system LytT family response regulator
MNIIIIEDETPALNRIKKMILEIEPEINILATADSIVSAVQVIESNKNIDLLLMDIELADGQSFEIFNRIEINIPVVFTTAYDEFALKAFKVNSVDYLLKPIEKDDLRNALIKFKTIQNNNFNLVNLKQLLNQVSIPQTTIKERFLVKLGERLISVHSNDIAYFNSKDKLTFLVTKNGNKYVVDYTLDELELLIDNKQFYHVNRQFIASISSIVNIHTYFNGKLKLQLSPPIEEEVIVSREKASDLKTWLGY